ncbi:signal transduction histidine kinase/ligand-binding sensor domain-containing protein [Duganella sp. 1224]|uniref:sensor histidine kinase n=1 Tax=Duganella sp. 1224 TaxID=2587052 RepID=UPI0015C80D76|nr:two-component regulator propeller domain-containing protein [Duganella sp. 1224]NYE62939.1 signal transduction histidine kinase/ligand-binding sensor domain-containing protein [Duganella sp. 1224]
MRSLFSRLCLLAAMLSGLPHAWALDPAVSLFDYHHDTWRRQDGAPVSITAMAQTSDGWLWIGTEQGLYRFDGLRFERYRSPTGQLLLSPRISALTATAGGDLLVGHINGGVNLIRQGEIVPLPAWSAAQVDTVYDLIADNDGSVWICTRSGLIHYAKGAWQTINASWGLPRQTVQEGTLDQYGQVWVRLSNEWYKLDREARRFHPTGHAGEDNAFYAPDGAMWRRKGQLIVRVPNGQPGPVQPREESRRYRIAQAHHLFDADGNLWLFGPPNGIARIRKQDLPHSDSFDPSQLPAERIAQGWQLSNPRVTGMLEDREGNLWAMTPSGLERFRNQRIRTIALPDNVTVPTLAADGQGRIWVGGVNLDQLWDVAGAAAPALREGERRLAVAGRDGAILSASARGIEIRRDGRLTTLPMPPACPGARSEQVNRLMQDRDALWASLRDCGLFRYRDGAWRGAASLGIAPQERVMTAAPDGAMWFGHRNGSLQHYQDGRLTDYAPAAAASLGALQLIDAQAEVVISGAEGTAVLRHGRFERLRAADPDVLNNLAGLVILPNGDRWLHTGLGLAHVRAADWNASVGDPRRPLRMELLDAADGYPGAPMLVAPVANGALDDSGKLWFASTEGIGVLDTTRMYRNPLPPALQITALSVDNRPYAPTPGLLLPQKPMRLDIGFAALSLTMPERMQVWYKLEGVDRDWQLAGTRRGASYSHLGPGSYRFTVKAANADGVWNEQGATLRFAIQPSFTQTAWFYLLCAGAALAAAYGLYLMRMRQLVRRLNAVLAARLLERERIARALHDSLLQSVQALVLRFSAVSQRLPADSAARAQLDALLAEADGVIVEGRNAVMGLRLASVHGGDLATAFTRLVERMQAEHRLAIALQVRGVRRRLDPLAWEEVYHIGAEALLNACRHASASRVLLALDYGAQELTLTVSDNGKGLADEVLRQGGKDGHWGLVGMRERAAALNGVLTLTPAVPRGLQVTARIPAGRAYDRDSRPGWGRRLRGWWQRRRG